MLCCMAVRMTPSRLASHVRLSEVEQSLVVAESLAENASVQVALETVVHVLTFTGDVIAERMVSGRGQELRDGRGDCVAGDGAIEWPFFERFFALGPFTSSLRSRMRSTKTPLCR